MDRYPFKAVIFDMDGVIVDSEAFYQEEMRAFSRDIGVEVADDELNGLVGASHKVFVAALVSWLEKAGEGTLTGDEAMERFHTWEQGYPYDYRSLLNPGVRDTISTLKERGVRVALASSTRPAGIREVLEACDLMDAFEVVVSGEQFRESKPNPEIYLHTLGILGLSAPECCCVEDSAYGITAGKRAGLTVFAKREERFGFSQAEADLVIDTIPDLLQFVG